MAADLLLGAPFAAWAGRLDDVPDPAFSGRLLGDGIALDPLEGEVRAPCEAVVVSVAPTGHSVTLRTAIGAEVLIHVGVDTVSLDGEGFETLVAAGDMVGPQQPLIRFDLDAVARRAPSLATPIIVINEGFAVDPVASGLVAAGQDILRLRKAGAVDESREARGGGRATVELVVGLHHGLHARPAARIGQTVRALGVEAVLIHEGRRADARSITALLALGIGPGDRLTVEASGEAAQAAIDAITALVREDGPAPSVTAPDRGEEGAAQEGTVAQPGTILAVRASPGGAVGPALQLRRAVRTLPDGAQPPAVERNLLDSAIQTLGERLGAAVGLGDIALAHQAILADPELLTAAKARIAAGDNAARAWHDATAQQVAAIRSSGQAVLVERIADILDVERQLVGILVGHEDALDPSGAGGAIILADELLPSELIALAEAGAAAIVTARGAATSHVAILAGLRDVPMLVGAGADILEIAEGTRLLVDDRSPVLTVEPDVEQQSLLDERREEHRARATAARLAAAEPAVTTDGVRIDVYANCGNLDDAILAAGNGADGCGLLRTEFLFFGRDLPPGEEEQVAIYTAIAEALAPRPLVVRTLDAGADKPLAYLKTAHEDNPALGVRGIRLSLAQPELLAVQLRAILRAVPADRLSIMLPMVTDLAELRAAATMLRGIEADLGLASPTPLGLMIETPAAAILADQFMREADFLSVGTNDLTQYVLAMDRMNAALAASSDALHPAVLRLIAQSCAAAGDHGRWAGLCGQLASDPDAAAILIGLGVTELSAAPNMVPAVKARVRTLEAEACKALALRALAAPDARAVRDLVARHGEGPL